MIYWQTIIGSLKWGRENILTGIVLIDHECKYIFNFTNFLLVCIFHYEGK